MVFFEAAKLKASEAAKVKELVEALVATEVCVECGRKVKTKAGLKRHVSSIHGKKWPMTYLFVKIKIKLVYKVYNLLIGWSQSGSLYQL